MENGKKAQIILAALKGVEVNREAGGVLTFPTPKKVEKVEVDSSGEIFVFVEGSTTGFPFEEVCVEGDLPENKDLIDEVQALKDEIVDRDDEVIKGKNQRKKLVFATGLLAVGLCFAVGILLLVSLTGPTKSDLALKDAQITKLSQELGESQKFASSEAKKVENLQAREAELVLQLQQKDQQIADLNARPAPAAPAPAPNVASAPSVNTEEQQMIQFPSMFPGWKDQNNDGKHDYFDGKGKPEVLSWDLWHRGDIGEYALAKVNNNGHIGVYTGIAPLDDSCPPGWDPSKAAWVMIPLGKKIQLPGGRFGWEPYDRQVVLKKDGEIVGSLQAVVRDKSKVPQWIIDATPNSVTPIRVTERSSTRPQVALGRN